LEWWREANPDCKRGGGKVIDDNDDDRPFCPSCHKAYSDHDGLIKTCKDLQAAIANVALLRSALVRFVGSAEYKRAMDENE
jgi:hypothetical protein